MVHQDFPMGRCKGDNTGQSVKLRFTGLTLGVSVPPFPSLMLGLLSI